LNLFNDDIEKFINSHTSLEAEILKKIDRQTNLKTLKPRMLSGAYQGRFLSIISKLLKPKYILEIGTFTGYSALCLSEGLSKEGKLITIDNDEETHTIACQFFEESNYSSQIDKLLGNALSIIKDLDYKFDLIFIDADKESYLEYYQLCIEKLNSGGLILADNVLWSGKVLRNPPANDRKTKGLIEFCNYVQNDARVENILIPIRDGIMMARKR
jgi:caffeoyl-CoA O-methyltransferase